MSEVKPVHPVLLKFHKERLPLEDDSRYFNDPEPKVIEAQQRILTPWTIGCASTGLEADYEYFLRYSILTFN